MAIELKISFVFCNLFLKSSMTIISFVILQLARFIEN